MYIPAGDLENEEEILEWLVEQLEKDEIEDVTDEMLDKLIKDGKTVAVLFCKLQIRSTFLRISRNIYIDANKTRSFIHR